MSHISLPWQTQSHLKSEELMFPAILLGSWCDQNKVLLLSSPTYWADTHLLIEAFVSLSNVRLWYVRTIITEKVTFVIYCFYWWICCSFLCSWTFFSSLFMKSEICYMKFAKEILLDWSYIKWKYINIICILIMYFFLGSAMIYCCGNPQLHLL